MLHLIDRRPSSRGRSAVNRERFLRRYKSHIQEAVKNAVREGTQKRWLYYDGVYIKYVLGYPIDAIEALAG